MFIVFNTDDIQIMKGNIWNVAVNKKTFVYFTFYKVCDDRFAL